MLMNVAVTLLHVYYMCCMQCCAAGGAQLFASVIQCVVHLDKQARTLG
jgi:hypothetical protein